MLKLFESSRLNHEAIIVKKSTNLHPHINTHYLLICLFETSTENILPEKVHIYPLGILCALLDYKLLVWSFNHSALQAIVLIVGNYLEYTADTWLNLFIFFEDQLLMIGLFNPFIRRITPVSYAMISYLRTIRVNYLHYTPVA